MTLRHALAALGAWLFLTAAALGLGPALLGAATPVIELACSVVGPAYAWKVTQKTDAAGNPILEFDATTRSTVRVSPRVSLPADQALRGGTSNVHHVVLPAVLTLVLVVAWPTAHRGERARRSAVGLALVALLTVTIAALLLRGKVALSLEALALASNERPVEQWPLETLYFLEQGGSWLLALATGLLAVRLGRPAVAPPRRDSPPDGAPAGPVGLPPPS